MGQSDYKSASQAGDASGSGRLDVDRSQREVSERRRGRTARGRLDVKVFWPTTHARFHHLACTVAQAIPWLIN